MKMRNLLTTALLSLFSLSIALSQAVQLAKQGDPFPYTTGAAFDQVAYEGVKVRIAKAEEVIKLAAQSIDSLKKEVSLQERLVSVQATVISQATTNYNILHQQYVSSLDTLKGLLTYRHQSLPLIEAVRISLSRKVRKNALTLPQLTLAFTDQREKLRWRPLKWGASGALVGMLGTAALIF